MNKTGTSREKRKFPRVNTSIKVRYRELQDGAEVVGVGSVTSDVSAGGVRFGVNKFISTARRLVLELYIPTLAEPIKAVSKVAWTEKANGGGDYQYQVGSEFMEITQRDQERIMKYLNSF